MNSPLAKYTIYKQSNEPTNTKIKQNSITNYVNWKSGISTVHFHSLNFPFATSLSIYISLFDWFSFNLFHLFGFFLLLLEFLSFHSFSYTHLNMLIVDLAPDFAMLRYKKLIAVLPHYLYMCLCFYHFIFLHLKEIILCAVNVWYTVFFHSTLCCCFGFFVVVHTKAHTQCISVPILNNSKAYKCRQEQTNKQ